MQANTPSGVDMTPFLFGQQLALSHAKRTMQMQAQHQQQCGLKDENQARNMSSGIEPVASLTDMAKRGKIIAIPASLRKQRMAFCSILSAIDLITEEAMRHMQRPTALVLRFKLQQDGSPSAVMKRLTEHCLRKSSARPSFVWVREVSPSDYNGLPGDYEHFHAVLIFDRHFHAGGTIIEALKRLKKRAWLESWHISCDEQTQKIVYHELRKPEQAMNYRHHVGYLAKIDTKIKESGKRIFGRSNIVKSPDCKPLSSIDLEIMGTLANDAVNPIVPISVLSVVPQFAIEINISFLSLMYSYYYPNALLDWERDKPKPARPPPH